MDSKAWQHYAATGKLRWREFATGAACRGVPSRQLGGCWPIQLLSASSPLGAPATRTGVGAGMCCTMPGSPPPARLMHALPIRGHACALRPPTPLPHLARSRSTQVREPGRAAGRRGKHRAGDDGPVAGGHRQRLGQRCAAAGAVGSQGGGGYGHISFWSCSARPPRSEPTAWLARGQGSGKGA